MILTKTQLWAGSCILIVVILASYFLGKQTSMTEVVETETTASSTTETATSTKPGTIKTPVKGGSSTAGFLTYTNSEYGFTVKYPTYSKVKSTFSTFHELGTNWRLYPGAAVQGKPVASFVIFNTDQGVYSTGKQSYPLYYTAEVRIGVSPNTKECYAPDPGYSNQKVTNVVINGTTFKRFSTSDGAMMKYVQAESYRTIKGANCVVIEQIKNGSNYRDELMAPGIADSTLNAYYATGETIVKSFTFTR